MKAAKKIHDQFGIPGDYVLLKLQVEAACRKDLRVPISKNIGKYAKEWHVHEQFIRSVIKLCRDNGILTLILVKSDTFIEFSADYIIRTENVKIKHSLKPREASVDKAKPADSNEVFLYMKEIGVPEMKAREDSYEFWDYWTERGWKRKSGEIKDWKATARRWVRRIKKGAEVYM